MTKTPGRFQEVASTHIAKDPSVGIITTYDTVKVTVLDTATGKTVVAEGRAPSAWNDAEVRAHQNALESARRKLGD
jgi:hypothetical protein